MNRAVLVVVIAVLLGLSVALGGVGGTVPGEADRPTPAVVAEDASSLPSDGADADSPLAAGDEQAVTLAASESVEANESDGERNETNGTILHRHPDEHETSAEDLGGWLADRLGDSLRGGAHQLSEGQYDRARALLGEEYDRRLDQFVELTDATAEEEATLRETRDKGVELTEYLEAFEETQAEYERALEAGETDRARELARELVALADRIEAVVSELERRGADVEELLDEDISEVFDAMATIRDWIQSQRATAEAEFLETVLDVTAERERISFLDPLVASGQLRTVDGQPVANETVQFVLADAPGGADSGDAPDGANGSAGGDSLTVETDAEGAFTFAYRPRDLPLETPSVLVEFVPAPASPYLGSEDTVAVTVEQVEPTLAVTSVPGTVGFGDEATVEGELVVGETPVDDASLAFFLGDEQVGTGTVSNGSFAEPIAVPAAVPAGERTLTVRLPYEERALAGVSDERTVTVTGTETTLSLAVTPVNETVEQVRDRELRVNGTLETVDGLGVTGESVTVRIDDAPVASLTTGTDGRFDDPVAVPVEAGDEATVTVVYEGEGNLEPSQAEQAAVLPEVRDAKVSQPDGSGVSSVVVVVLAAAVAALSVGGLWWYRRRAAGDDGWTSTADDVRATEPAADVTPTQSLFERAHDQLRAGDPDRTVQLCYAAVRAHLEARLGVRGSHTHWEFYRECTTAGGEPAEALREVTEAYERATYAPGNVPTDDGLAALERARQLCDLDDPLSETVADD